MPLQARNVTLQTCSKALQTCKATLQVCNEVLQACKTALQARNVTLQAYSKALQTCNAALQICNEVLQACAEALRASAAAGEGRSQLPLIKSSSSSALMRAPASVPSSSELARLRFSWCSRTIFSSMVLAVTKR